MQLSFQEGQMFFTLEAMCDLLMSQYTFTVQNYSGRDLKQTLGVTT